MTPFEETQSIAYWQGKVDGALASHDQQLDLFGKSLDRIESKVNAIKNENSERKGSLKLGAWLGGIGASVVVVTFGAVVGKVI